MNAPLAERIQQRQPVPLDDEAGELAGCVSSGVDVDPVIVEIGFAHRRVAVHDHLSKISLVIEKVFADPQHVLLALALERYSRFHPGMDKEEIAATKRSPEFAEKLDMAFWKRRSEATRESALFFGIRVDRGAQPIRHQRLEAAQNTPIAEHRRVAEELRRKGLVVALQ